MPFYLGVDIGGTKTDFVLADQTRELARTRCATLKRMRTDAASASASLEIALRELTAASSVSMQSIARTCIGTAGHTVPMVTDWLRQAFAARVSGDLLLIGDVEIALDAAFLGEFGVVVLAGTGSNVAARTAEGQLLSVGGWGPVLADQGSGHRIGVRALRSIFLAIDADRGTSLLSEVLGFWELGSRDELVAFANRTPAPDFSRLTELVLHCAAAGDAVAAEVLRHEGEDLGYLVRLLLRRIAGPKGSTSIPIAFAGSVMEKVPPVRQALMAAVHNEFPMVQPMEGTIDPLLGALWRVRTPSA